MEAGRKLKALSILQITQLTLTVNGPRECRKPAASFGRSRQRE